MNAFAVKSAGDWEDDGGARCAPLAPIGVRSTARGQRSEDQGGRAARELSGGNTGRSNNPHELHSMPVKPS